MTFFHLAIFASLVLTFTGSSKHTKNQHTRCMKINYQLQILAKTEPFSFKKLNTTLNDFSLIPHYIGHFLEKSIRKSFELIFFKQCVLYCTKVHCKMKFLRERKLDHGKFFYPRSIQFPKRGPRGYFQPCVWLRQGPFPASCVICK